MSLEHRNNHGDSHTFKIASHIHQNVIRNVIAVSRRKRGQILSLIVMERYDDFNCDLRCRGMETPTHGLSCNGCGTSQWHHDAFYFVTAEFVNDGFSVVERTDLGWDKKRNRARRGLPHMDRTLLVRAYTGNNG